MDDWNSRFFQSFLWCEFLVQVFSQILRKDIDFLIVESWELRTLTQEKPVLICSIDYILFLCCVWNRILYHFLQMKVEYLFRWFEIFLILTACGYDPIWLQYYFFNIFQRGWSWSHQLDGYLGFCKLLLRWSNKRFLPFVVVAFFLSGWLGRNFHSTLGGRGIWWQGGPSYTRGYFFLYKGLSLPLIIAYEWFQDLRFADFYHLRFVP